jgi:hypothetical protein
MLFDSLRSGKAIDTLQKWIDDVILEIKKALGLVDEVAEGAIKVADDVAERIARRRKIIDDVESGKIKLDEDVKGNKRKIGDQTRTSNYAEMKMDDFFETKAFTIGNNQGTLKRISSYVVDSIDDTIKKGIDGIYEFSSPPPKYVITEVKYNTASLSKTATKSGGAQMSERWVRHALRKGAVSPEMRREILSSGYEPLLCNVTKQGEIAVNLIHQTITNATKGGTWNAKFTP